MSKSDIVKNLIIKNAHVVDPANKLDETLDVHVKNGRLVKWGKGLKSEGAETLDAKGLYLLPGLVDIHVHFRDPGFPEKEDLVDFLKEESKRRRQEFEYILHSPMYCSVKDKKTTVEFSRKCVDCDQELLVK